MFLLSLDQASAEGTKEQVPWRKPPPPCAQVLAPDPRTTGPTVTRSWVFCFNIVPEDDVLSLGKKKKKKTLLARFVWP